MLTVTDLVSRRDGRDIFAPLSLQIDAGQCLEVIGANGAGKTTLLRTLAGLHGQYVGSIHAQPLLYQGHRLGLDELLSPTENIRWHAELEGSGVGDETLIRSLRRVGLAQYALTPVGQALSRAATTCCDGEVVMFNAALVVAG